MTPLSDAEVGELRREFPALERYAYFASNGLGVLPQRTVTALTERLERLSRSAIVATMLGNAPLVDEARGRVAKLLACDTSEVAFCRNTSEGVLWVANSLRVRPGDEVLVAQGEYSANVLPWMAQEVRGLNVRLLRQRERRITPELVAEAWRSNTRLLSVSFVQYNSGFRADLQALAAVAHERGGFVFCDAIQGLGALRLDVREADIDFLSAGTHKWLLGLQGLGVFYCRRERLADLDPIHMATGSLLRDAEPDEADTPYEHEPVAEARRFEEGTRNFIGIAALNESLKLIEEIGIERIEARIYELTQYIAIEVSKRGFRIESPREDKAWSGILLFAPPPNAPSAVELVSAMHRQRITINAREGCIHMGVHFYNTRADIDRMLGVIDENFRA